VQVAHFAGARIGLGRPGVGQAAGRQQAAVELAQPRLPEIRRERRSLGHPGQRDAVVVRRPDVQPAVGQDGERQPAAVVRFDEAHAVGQPRLPEIDELAHVEAVPFDLLTGQPVKLYHGSPRKMKDAADQLSIFCVVCLRDRLVPFAAIVRRQLVQDRPFEIDPADAGEL